MPIKTPKRIGFNFLSLSIARTRPPAGGSGRAAPIAGESVGAAYESLISHVPRIGGGEW